MSEFTGKRSKAAVKMSVNRTFGIEVYWTITLDFMSNVSITCTNNVDLGHSNQTSIDFIEF